MNNKKKIGLIALITWQDISYLTEKSSMILKNGFLVSGLNKQMLFKLKYYFLTVN